MRGLALAGMFALALAPAFAAPDITAGKKLYDAHCAACHGSQGEGGRGVKLTTLTRASNDEALFGIIRKGIPGTEMPPAPLGDEEINDLVVFVRGLHRDAPASSPPSSGQGEQIYRNAGCSRCHTIGSEGGVLGPDLSKIGARGPDYLRRALLDPQAHIPDNFGQYHWYTVIPDNFLQVRITTQDGREITGARMNEDSFSIQLRDVSGRVYSFWKSDLKELHKDWGKSPMPSYRDKLTPSELDALVSYLASLGGSR